ncbi:PTS sugar transporter subunit IIA [Sporanaerobacter acetigenes]|uniref:PTS system, galactitol-specific IIA component n=1 Tax=Sporanaerobacter acetigenes DSM 13106 TaxID=1123281 RepID=A0A1M5YQ98_9FIRM|nr:PTS sugar transporter subunit IIA [Sporanaerobacter acetigenes]SHI14034.1 PTS system, galactitol-specific IIA component [Sporanaerobacter acetigenes DSM 13106]
MKEPMELLKEELIFIDVEAKDRGEAIEKIAKELYRREYVKESYINAILDREKVFPTGLPTEKVGIAIPHTDAIHVNKSAMAIGVLKNPVIFQMMGMPEENVNVNIIFMMALNEPKGQIEMLQKLMSIFQNKSLLLKMRQAKTKEEIMKVFSNTI